MGLTNCTDDSFILEKLEALISEGNSLGNKLEELSPPKRKRYFPQGVKWRGTAFNLLNLRFGNNSYYYQDFNEALDSDYTFDGADILRSVGVLEYIHDAIKCGLTDDLYYKNEIIIFSDILEQASDFLKNGLKLAAAIYGRIVLETTIMEFSKKNNIHKPKFDPTIIELRKRGLIQSPFEIALRSNYKIGSLAAHGNQEFQNLSENEIKEFLSFIRDKVLTLE